MTLKLERWPWKTTEHLFYLTSSLVNHYVAIDEFKLELQSWNAQFRSKSAIFFVSCELEIWQMNLKNNTAPLLFYFRLCALFCSYWWTKTGVTFRKRPIWVKIVTFCPVTLKFDGWHWKTTGNLSWPTSSLVHHFIAIGQFKLESQSGNIQIRWKSAFVPSDLEI